MSTESSLFEKIKILKQSVNVFSSIKRLHVY